MEKGKVIPKKEIMDLAKQIDLEKKLQKALEDKVETYSIRVKCTNCGMGESIVPANQHILQIPKGFSIRDYSYIKGCPFCGCDSLVRVGIYG